MLVEPIVDKVSVFPLDIHSFKLSGFDNCISLVLTVGLYRKHSSLHEASNLRCLFLVGKHTFRSVGFSVYHLISPGLPADLGFDLLIRRAVFFVDIGQLFRTGAMLHLVEI